MVLILFLLPSLTQLANDPVPGIMRSKQAARNLDCERTTTEQAQSRFPGEVETQAPRGDFIERSAVICTERIMKQGERLAQTEALLMTLEDTVSGFATAIETINVKVGAKKWHVESYIPDPTLAAKIAFATKNALVQRGLLVSDRVPNLTAGDIDILARMKPTEAYPLACKRYLELDELAQDQGLIGVVLRDSRETILHAGVCLQGKWQWIQ